MDNNDANEALQRGYIEAISSLANLQFDAFASLEGLTWNQMTPSQRVLANNLCAHDYAELKREGNDAKLVKKDPLGGLTMAQLEEIGKHAFDQKPTDVQP